MLMMRIFQTENPNWVFRSYDYAVEHGFDEESYEEVWCEEVDDTETLNDIYERFNLRHPEGYAARSLSMSDIVELGSERYYVDRLGFKRL